jgi:dsRNA-specific ribonuclease
VPTIGLRAARGARGVEIVLPEDEGHELARGQGRSKLEAEQAAARMAFEGLTKTSASEP